MKSNTLAMTLAMAASFTSAEASSHERFHSQMAKRQFTQTGMTSQGCFSSGGGNLQAGDTYTWQSSKHCGELCYGKGMPVAVLYNANACGCAETLPSSGSAVNPSQCSSDCVGFPDEPCGGTSAYTVWLTGLDDSVGTDDTESSSSSSASPSQTTVLSTTTPPPSTRVISADPTTIIRGQSTIIESVPPVVQTVAAEETSPSSPTPQASGGTNTIGIAVGVVVGILALVAAIVFGVFYARRRRRMKNAENGHARADSLNAFVASGGSLPGMNIPAPPRTTSDSRLDPRIMVERRRQSTGSVFADNEDYSRRILKVANPDN